MKQLFLLLVLCIYGTLAAQTSDDMPEYLNHISFRDTENDQTIPLEKVFAKMKNKVKMGGFAGSSYGYFIEGVSSSVSIKDTENAEFILNKGGSEGESDSDSDVTLSSMNEMMREMMDPSRNISLYKLSVNKGEREALMQDNNGVFGAGGKDSSEKIVFNVKKEKGNYVFIVQKKLKPGEYAFIDLMGSGADQNVTAFCFRVE